MHLALVLLAFALTLAVVARQARNRSWRRVAERLYAGNAALWESEQPWIAYDGTRPAALGAPEAEPERSALEALGFAFVGRVEHLVRVSGAESPVMAAFVGEEGRVWAVTHAVDGHEVVELESAFADGVVLGTNNDESGRFLAWPPGFDMRHEAFGTAAATLLAEQRERLSARSGFGPAPVRCDTLDDVLAEKNRQQAQKRAFRQSCDFMTDEEIRHCARAVGLSRAAAEGVLREYRRTAAEACEGRSASGDGGPGAAG